MVLCEMCWKNITGKPRTIISKNDKNYRICNLCLQKYTIQEMLDNDWTVVFECPDLKEMMTIRSEAT